MWEIAIVIASAVFVITCLFIIRLLIVVNRKLAPLINTIEDVCEEGRQVLKTTDKRLESLDSLFRTISNLGDIGEFKSQELKSYLLEHQQPVQEASSLGEEVARWALSTASIYRKFNEKRRHYEK